jgi:hypothetical protein
MTYAAWLKIDEYRGAFATWRRQLIVADSAEAIVEALGGIAQPVELDTIETHDWLKQAAIGGGATVLDLTPEKEATMSDFRIEDGTTVQEAVFTALGAASACWTNLAGAGEFESGRCKAIGEELVAAIRNGRLRDEATGLTPVVSRWQPLDERGQVVNGPTVDLHDPREVDGG